MSDLHLRPYERRDLGPISRLDALCFEERFRFSQADLRRFAEASNAHVTIAEAGERLAGFCIMHINEASDRLFGYIVTLDVDPDFRRRGLACRLMRFAEAGALAEGCSEVALHVFTENTGAIHFYEREGYALKSEVKNFYGGGADALVYRKRLRWQTQSSVEAQRA